MTSRLFSQASQRFFIVVALVGLLSSSLLVHAQTFNSGSTGADGALTVTKPGTYDFYPGNTQVFPTPVDPEGDNIYNFTTITIGPNVVLRMSAKFLNGPVFWLASGAVQINGTIDLNGENGHPGTTVPAERQPSIPGVGGYPGGIGRLGGSSSQAGSGPGGGKNQCGGGGGAGHATAGAGCGAGLAYGNDFLVPLLGGSGGAGASDPVSGGGGAGGGALLIASSASILVNGTILSNGGGGGAPGGGGGSGGAIRLAAGSVSGTGILNALGGGSPVGASGSKGRIRLEAFQQNFTGTTNPAHVPASPFALFLPTNQPSVRVVSIDGNPVLATPTGSFTVPDVAINKSTPVTVQIKAFHMPLNATVKLFFFSENGSDLSPAVSALSGTEAESNATASVTLPPGFSRGYVRATWANQ